MQTEISNLFYLCIYNLKHALEDSRFILLKFCCLNVRSLHAYSSSEIANVWHKCECFPFPCPWQTLLINCVILSCHTLANSQSVLQSPYEHCSRKLLLLVQNWQMWNLIVITTLIGLAVTVAMWVLWILRGIRILEKGIWNFLMKQK